MRAGPALPPPPPPLCSCRTRWVAHSRASSASAWSSGRRDRGAASFCGEEYYCSMDGGASFLEK